MMHICIEKELKGTMGTMSLDLDITIPKGRITTLFGPSGVGKTCTLNIISGLLRPERGFIQVENTYWFHATENIHLRPQRRSVGYVFQDYALFPNMTVEENISFARSQSSDAKEMEELIDIMELKGLLNRRPTTLSGGQKQRVALARALVQRPKILLLDEPLSALDPGTRVKLQDYISRVHEIYELTTILISHDIGEIYRLSDNVLVLEGGKVIKEGPPSSVFTDEKISGKFRFKGRVLQIEKADVVQVVTVLVQNEIIKVVSQESDTATLQVGDHVMVASKAFNPVIYKITP